MATIFCKLVRAAFYASRRTFWWKQFFRSFSLFFGHWPNNFLTLGKLFSKVLQEFFKDLSSFLSDLEQKISDLCQIFFRAISKLLSTRSDEHIWWKNTILKKFFSIFLDFGQNFFWPLAKIEQKTCENCFQSVLNTSWRNRFFLIILFPSYIRILNKTFSEFWRKRLPQSCQNCFVLAQMNTLMKILFSKTLLHFFNFVETFSDFWHFFCKIVATSFKEFKRTLWWKLNFWTNLHIIFRLLAKNSLLFV